MAHQIKCESLTKHYQGIKALDNLDLELEINQPIGIVGPNGAGKSTLFSILCGFIKPNSGKTKVLGYSPDAGAIKGKLALLPQDTSMFKGVDVLTQLKHYARLQNFNRHDAKKETERALSLVQATSFAKQFPETLSFGQRKRIMLAQALIGKPELILMDEPTAGLDPVAATEVRNLLRELGREYHVIISSHNLTEIEDICSDIAILNKGKLLIHSSLAELKQSGQCFSLKLDNTDTPHLPELLKEIKEISKIENDAKDQKSFLIYYNTGTAEQLQIKILSKLGEAGVPVSEFKKGKALADEIAEIIKGTN